MAKRKISKRHFNLVFIMIVTLDHMLRSRIYYEPTVRTMDDDAVGALGVPFLRGNLSDHQHILNPFENR